MNASVDVCAVLDVAVGPLTRANCQVAVGDVICIRKLQCPVLLSDAIYLVPLSVIIINSNCIND